MNAQMNCFFYKHVFIKVFINTYNDESLLETLKQISFKCSSIAIENLNETLVIHKQSDELPKPILKKKSGNSYLTRGLLCAIWLFIL